MMRLLVEITMGRNVSQRLGIPFAKKLGILVLIQKSSGNLRCGLEDVNRMIIFRKKHLRIGLMMKLIGNSGYSLLV